MRLRHHLAVGFAIVLGMIAGNSLAAERASKDDARMLSLVTLNLWHDKGDWPQRQRLIVASLRRLRPDVITLQEVIQHDGLPNQAQTIARALGYQYIFSSVDAIDAPKRFGNAILSRHPVLAQGWKKLAPLDDYRTIAFLRIAIDGQAVNIYTTHLHWTEAGGAIRATQVADALDFIADTRDGLPSVLAGDLNAPMQAPELQPLLASLVDAYATIHPDAKPADRAHSTLNLNQYAPLHIDQVLLQRDAFVPVATRIILDTADAKGVWPSDHYGVLARFRLLPTATSVDGSR